MNGQLTITDALARTTDPATSHEAAPGSARRSAGQRLVLDALAAHGPGTDFDLAEWTGRQQTSMGKRRLELQRAGLVEPTGGRRPSPSGSAALVWRLTAEGYRAATEEPPEP